MTEHEVAVALALGVPINGTAPDLRSTAFKSAGRTLFHRAGVPVPLGREDVHSVDDVAAAAEWVRASRPAVGAVVLKLDDSGAGDGNAVVHLRDESGSPRDPHALLADIEALPAWFLHDLAAGGGVVEEMVVGDSLRSPSVQVDLLPGGGVRVLATHDQVLGGSSGQVYLGCRFPADASYAPDLAGYGEAVGRELAVRGCAGRAGVDFMAARTGDRPWALSALEVNLRKGGTTHPFSALRSLVPGHYDAAAGAWITDADGTHPGLPLDRQLRRPLARRAQSSVGHRRRARRPACSSTGGVARASCCTCSAASPSTAGSVPRPSDVRRSTPTSCMRPRWPRWCRAAPTPSRSPVEGGAASEHRRHPAHALLEELR